MGMVMRRLLGAVALIVLVPSLTYVYFASLYSETPVLSGLLDYLEATFVHFDLGRAEAFGNPDIGRLLSEGVAVDVALMGGGLAIGIATGALTGAYLAQRRADALSAAFHLLGAVAIAAPAAFTAFALVYVTGTDGSGIYRPLTQDPWAWAQGLWVPWLAVGLPIAGAVMRVSAGATRDALSDDAVRTAHAKGVAPGRVLRRHTLIFAVPPISGYTGAAVNLVILNSAIVEQIFNLPGSFRYLKSAIDDPDLGLLQSMTLVMVVYVVAGNLIADLVAARVDPRTR